MVDFTGFWSCLHCTCDRQYPKSPKDLLDHKLLAFSNWTFRQKNGKDQKRRSFEPYLTTNDYTGLTAALLAGVGIGDLPPLVQPELIRDGRLVEVMLNGTFS